ncbi:tyrosine-protein phosphatase non-receptor type 21-like [Ruditapes philippinarum]|uniref:tyrosine-protein phosphatase non-receptor type 21-like n=1 Tax=Ruditapes philippinarum TaxID=129788 RepID=UPI00295BCE10|nr:tyrosine-protein phosphatase non-receptor type 21-like [Ruditapes philippinarum]
MPFGLRFKKTRRYDISTKNIYMVEVQMLDGSYLECTLTSDSTGHECLDGISQKIELQEIQYFGLRYVTKKIQFRWVDLNKPLKKQLEKYAQASQPSRSPRLYFGVIFYIASAHKIVDDVARYQYYLQLKNDIVDGRLPLTVDQVIRLAAYSLQVEFNDYESEKPAADYFTDNMVFPKNLTKDENILQELQHEVVQVYMGLQGVHPVKAEIQYMKEIQMMDGYGMEYYIAKDERGKELYLGTSYVGIFARYLDGQQPIFFKWTDVARLQQSKKTFEIDTSKSSVQYTMEDSDTAKYLKRMCLLQQKFYKSTKIMLSASLSDLTDFAETEVLPDIQQSVMPQSDVPVQQLAQSQTSLTSLKYGEQKYEPDSRSASVTTDDYYNRSQQSLNISAQDLTTAQFSTDPHQDRRPSSASSHMSNYHQQQQQQQHHMGVQNSPDPTEDPNFASRKAALPEYRHAPDYATVMKQKMTQSQMTQQPQQQQQHHHVHSNQHINHSNQHIQHSNHQMHHSNQQIHDLNQNIANTHIYAQSEDGLAFSQPEISNPHVSYNPEGPYQMGGPVRNYPMTMYTNVFQDQTTGNFMQYRMNERQTNLVMQPTYSSPELNTQGLPQQYSTNEFLNVNEQYVYQYKPPPPYPRASNSTPDLAIQTHFRLPSDSPDLLSRRTLGESALSSRSNLEVSIDNLTDTIPEVVQISETTVETETGLAEVQHHSLEIDDASSDHSNSTFHVKETDSEPDEPFVRAIPQRQSSKSKITVRFVAPNKAPPPSTSKEVATNRESFRRMMIARSGSFTPGVLRENSKRLNHINRSLRVKEKNSIDEHILETNRSVNKSPSNENMEEQKDPVKENVKNVLSKVTESSGLIIENGSENTSGREVMRSQSDANKTNNKVKVIHEKAVSLDSSAERQQLLDKLKHSEPEVPSTISEHERLVSSQEKLVDYEDSDSDQGDTPASPVGPLKLAAMNGLTMSRPMVLALMNDETRAPKDERRKVLEKKLSENLVFKEFEETPKRIMEYECNVARLPENNLKNRFRDVLPYDGTRVKLNPRKDNSSGYINASHIKLTVGHRLWWYIATQAPMDNTPVDFWQMVWEQEVEVIAMLTALMELGRPKCYPYWPQDPGHEHKLIFGDYEVQLLFTNDSLCYITNRISLRHVPSKKERQIWHLQYTDWPDHGCPDDMYGFLGFLDEIESVQRLAESEEGSGKKSPIVVHCSAGVGRTGVVILTQVMKWCLEHNQQWYFYSEDRGTRLDSVSERELT